MATVVEHIENRSDRRYETNAAMTYFCFSSKKTPAFAATAYNCSERGLCFQTLRPLKPGQYVCIRTGPAPKEFILGGRKVAMMKSFSLAEVRWCRESDSPKIAGYRVGIKYL
ncbi:MAG: hypothetical protein WCE56_04985 [Desulfobacterales bacterium]